jgi:hypothetical protein
LAEVEKIRKEFSSRAAFVIVYIKEAHPEDEWQMESNVKSDIVYSQPQTFEARMDVARKFVDRMKVDTETVVDDIENTALACYAAWPERIYVVNREGRIVYKGGVGPFYFAPDELRSFLETLPDASHAPTD